MGMVSIERWKEVEVVYKKDVLVDWFLNGAFDLTFKAIEKLPLIPRLVWKARVASDGNEWTPSLKEVWACAGADMEALRQRAIEKRVEMNAGKTVFPYGMTDAMTEVALMLPEIVRDLGINIVDNSRENFVWGWGAVFNCLTALRSMLPRNRYGRNAITVQNRSEKELGLAINTLAEVARRVGVELPMIPADLATKFTREGK